MNTRALAVSVAALLLIGAGRTVIAQTPAGPTFEVASVKPSNPNPDPANPLSAISLMLPQPGGIRGSNIPVRMLIMAAYELKQDAQLSGGPQALLATKYDITAQAAGGTLVMKELPQMLRALLVERFKLKAHTESRELPIYDLVLARSDGRLGPDLKPSQSDCSKPEEVLKAQGAALAKGDVGSFVGKPRPCSVATDPSGGPLNLLLRGDGQEMKALAEILWQFTGRPVRDKTGLTGRYDFALKLDLQMMLALAQKLGANVPAAAANIPQAEGSSLMTALSEGLGLKLESTRAPMDVVIIDSVEAPDPD